MSFNNDVDSAVNYLPIVKARQGELRALAELEKTSPSELTPVIELVEAQLDPLQSPASQPEVIKLVDKVVKAWTPQHGQRVIVDTLGVELESAEFFVNHDPNPTEFITPHLLRMVRDRGVDAVPVIRLTDDPSYRAQLADALPSIGGACLRLTPEDLDDTGQTLQQAVAERLSELGLQAESVDLILDFGAVDDDNTLAMAKRLARFVLPDLEGFAWRRFAIASGAFPVNLSEVNAYQTRAIPRRDRNLFQTVRAQIGRRLDYGDYAVTHPVLQSGIAFAAPPQIRYTTSADWFVVKGARNDRRGHRQFFDICGRLRRELGSSVAPPEQSWGDAEFHAAADKQGTDADGPGNASTWRAIATSHHIGHVMHGLRTRGEP